MGMKYIDIDGHILEPPNLWVDNIAPRYRDRAMRFIQDDQGLECWTVDGQINAKLRDHTSANLATIGKSAEWRRENLFEKHSISWEDGRSMSPAGGDPQKRVALMDEEEIDASILFPSLGLSWMGVTRDPGLATAYCRVYNDWIIDFCSAYPDRLYPALTLPWSSVPESVAELKRTEDIGPRSIMTPASAPHDISYGEQSWDPIWQAYQDQDLPISLHPGSGGTSPSSILYPDLKTVHWWGFTNSALDVQLGFLGFFQGGVFDRFPDLKLVVLESGCLWVPYMLGRMDEKFEVLGFTTPMKMKPSEYFKRQCWVDMDPDDEFGPIAIDLLGADKLMWAYDYPHSDSPTDPVKHLRKTLSGLPEEDQGKVAGETAIDLFHLAVGNGSE